MKKYTLKKEEPELLYRESIENNTQEEAIALLKDKRVVKYRTKTVKAGKQVYVEIYPIWRTYEGIRRARQKNERTAQEKLNDKNAKKHAVRLVNQNFTDDDYWATFTYNSASLPTTREEAEKNLRSFIRVLRNKAAKKYGIKLKCFYVTEYEGDETKGQIRWHHHLIINYPNRDELESLWKFGGRNSVRKLLADEFGYEGLVTYLLKGKRKGRRYGVTRGMEKYKTTVADGKITRGRAMKLVFGEANGREFFEKNYPGYRLSDMAVKFSNTVSGVYICVRMRRGE